MSNRYYLVHRMPGKGEPRKDHKYISREWKNNKWVYTYKDDSKGSSKQASIKDDPKSSSKLSTTQNSTKKVSSEYEAEVAYNSQKNNYFGKTTSSNKSSARNMVDAGRKTVEKTTRSTTQNSTKKASSEYEAEVAYNSQKNNYFGKSNTSGKKAAQTAANNSTKKVSSEYEAEVAYNSQKNQYPTLAENAKKAEENKSGWDKLVDGVKDLAWDVGFEVEYAFDKAKDWVEDVVDTIGDATIGELKDAMGEKERGRLYTAKRELSAVNYNLKDIKNQIEEDTERVIKNPNDKDALEDLNITRYWAKKAYEESLNAEAEYVEAKKQYDKTMYAKIDTALSWLKDKFGIEDNTIEMYPAEKYRKENDQIEDIIEEKILNEKYIEERIIKENILKEDVITFADSFKKIDKAESPIDRLDAINPVSYAHGFRQNKYDDLGAYGSMAYLLRMKGYDVVANTSGHGNVDIDTISAWYHDTDADDWTRTKVDSTSITKSSKAYADYWNSLETVKKELDKSGGSGHLHVSGSKGYEKDYVYEYINGELTIRDVDTRRVYDYDSWRMASEIINAGKYEVSILDTSSRDVVADVLSAVKNRKRD